MRVLITGASGYVPRYVAEDLAADHELVLFSRRSPEESGHGLAARAPFVRGDLTNLDDCRRAVEGVDEERARRELTALLPLARRKPGDEEPASYRYRSIHTGLDVTARVVIEAPMDDAPDARIAVVVSVSVRETRRVHRTR